MDERKNMSFDRKAAALIAASLLVFAPAGAALAHHSFAMFDQTRQVTVVGTVKEFQWTNPHAYIEIMDGAGTTWSIELNSPNNLIRQGWKRTSLKIGDKVTLVLNPLRDGKPGGLFNAVTLPDGAILGNPKPTGPINVPTP